MKLSDRIKRWQQRQQITNQAAADRLGIPLRTFCDWKSGEHSPRGFALKMLVEKLKETK